MPPIAWSTGSNLYFAGHDYSAKSFSSTKETFFSELFCPESIKSFRYPPIQFANLLTISLLWRDCGERDAQHANQLTYT
jgi:hypothetical protein